MTRGGQKVQYKNHTIRSAQMWMLHFFLLSSHEANTLLLCFFSLDVSFRKWCKVGKRKTRESGEISGVGRLGSGESQALWRVLDVTRWSQQTPPLQTSLPPNPLFSCRLEDGVQPRLVMLALPPGGATMRWVLRRGMLSST